MKVCLGGTFHPFHVGHGALLRRAAQADEVFVGITAGDLALREGREIPDWETRAEVIQAHWDQIGGTAKLALKPLHDVEGPAATEAYDAIVVSDETVSGAHAINTTRHANGLPALAIWNIGRMLATDGLPISATRVHRGDIDAQGQRQTPVRVAVGSQNPVKLAAVEVGFTQLLGDVDVRGFGVASGVPEQPQEGETLTGARNRASAAKAAWPDADYGVGVEAGLQRDDDGWFDVQACVVVGGGEETRGWGPAFQYPDWVTERARAGEMISDILGPVADDPAIGGTTGAIGYLTRGVLDRTELTRSAVVMAMTPRIRGELYHPQS